MTEFHWGYAVHGGPVAHHGQRGVWATASLRLYRALWVSCWGPVAMIGVAMGLLRWSVTDIIGLFLVTVAVTVPALLAIAYARRADDEPIPTGRLARIVGPRAAAAGVGVVLLAILAAVVGDVMWPLLLVAAGTSPWTWALVLRRCRRGGRLPSPAAGDPPATHSRTPDAVKASAWAPAVEAFGDSELTIAWRASYTALQSAASPAVRDQLVTLRQAYLDEIERRNPKGFKAWLDSGARAAGNPDKYLAQHKRDEPSAN